MGFAVCRFDQDEVCHTKGSQEWHIYLSDLEQSINVPSMWKHYMTNHLVQPTPEEREVIMLADPKNASGKFRTTRGLSQSPELKVLYVERLGENLYSHDIGTVEDTEFIGKLESILENISPLQTKGINYKPGYRG